MRCTESEARPDKRISNLFGYTERPIFEQRALRHRDEHRRGAEYRSDVCNLRNAALDESHNQVREWRGGRTNHAPIFEDAHHVTRLVTEVPSSLPRNV